MNNLWVLRPLENADKVTRLSQELNDLPEALARTLVLRGIETFDQARHFFRPSLDDLHDPFLMKDMDLAVDRVEQAIRGDDHVMVYGDYDVDGTTSTALMTTFLREQGVRTSFFIPDRLKDGYGLGPAGIDHAVDIGAQLIIALDCGITAHKEAEYARERGLELIICDHHTALETVPDAVAVLDPKRRDCPYPFKELCGCGVTFKLIQGVLQQLGEPVERAYGYLDLVAIATASDIVPVGGENRILLNAGMQRLQDQPRLGLRKLADEARLDLKSSSTSLIVFGLGPRINAAGRLGDAQRAVDLMLAEDDRTAADLAARLEQVNLKRRDLDQETLNQALSLAQQQMAGRDWHTVVLHQPDWHLGVIGIVASRLVENFYRPTIMLTSVNGQAKGSARSIQGVNIYNALMACEDLLDEFGGHDYAAGLSLPVANIPAFKERFDAAVANNTTPELMLQSIEFDAQLNLNLLNSRFWAVLKQFAPFGPENSTPVFKAKNLAVVGHPRTVGKDGTHLKFTVRHQDHPVHTKKEAIGFRMHQHLPTLEASQRSGKPFELLFSVEENNWKGRKSLQLRARDLRLQ